MHAVTKLRQSMKARSPRPAHDDTIYPPRPAWPYEPTKLVAKVMRIGLLFWLGAIAFFSFVDLRSRPLSAPLFEQRIVGIWSGYATLQGEEGFTLDGVSRVDDGQDSRAPKQVATGVVVEFKPDGTYMWRESVVKGNGSIADLSLPMNPKAPIRWKTVSSGSDSAIIRMHRGDVHVIFHSDSVISLILPDSADPTGSYTLEKDPRPYWTTRKLNR